jgi:uncharacterized protein (TIGR02246 family)
MNLTRYALAVVLFFSLPSIGAEKTHKQLDEAFGKAALAGNAKAIAQLYTKDAVAYYPEGEFKGKEAIEKNWAQFFDMFQVKEFKMEGDYRVFGDTSSGWGTWKMVMTSKKDGKEQEVKGRFTEVAKRVGGNWRFLVDHASVALPPPAPESK